MKRIWNWFSTLSMTIKYLIALVLIIIPIVFGGLYTQSKNDDMDYYGASYNVVLTQRMRVFLISNYAQQLYDGNNTNNLSQYMNADLILTEQTPLLEEQIDALLYGSEPLGIPAPNNPEIETHLNSIKDLITTYNSHVDALLEDPTSETDLDFITSHTLELDQELFLLATDLETIYMSGYQQLSVMNLSIIVITVLIILFALMQIRLVRKIEFQARYDQLTNCRSRSYLYDSITRLQAEEYSVVCIDIHHFKLFNDVYGNHLGDYILTEFSKRLRESFGDKNVYRYGGDEFMVLIHQDSNTCEDVIQIPEYILINMLDNYQDQQNRNHSINVSIGLAGWNIGIESFSDKLKFAEELRIDSRNYKLQPISCCSKEEADKRISIDQAIDQAIKLNQIVAYFQPLHRVDGTIKGFESLARWRFNNEILSPGRFIPLINAHGLGYQLDLKMIELAGKAFPQLMDAVPDINPYVSINIAIDTITHISSDEISKALEATKIPKENIILEILEDVVIGTATRQKLRDLRDKGYTIALDDFTTGATSFDYLTLEEFNLVKIDQMVVKQIQANPHRREILRELIQMIHTSNKDALIEGVETESDLKIISALGIDVIQGYYYSKPLPLEDAVAYLKNYVNQKTANPSD